jgi:hypothetical protein
VVYVKKVKEKKKVIEILFVLKILFLFLGDDCEFLHEYDMAKMPECYFFSKFGQCMNKECAFLHLDPESKIRGMYFIIIRKLIARDFFFCF